MKVLNKLEGFGQQEVLALASAHQGSEETLKEEYLRLLDSEVERQLMSEVKVGHRAGSNVQKWWELYGLA
jgi:asparagine synthetase B (glutamine-hydrolysing)